MDIALLVSLLNDHKWLPLAALLIGLVVRALKSDGPIPINVPAQYRSALAIGLGLIYTGLLAVAAGKPWRDALVEGLFAAAFAILGHTGLVEWLRGGREPFEAKPEPKGDPK